jgi:hypothetical protein
VKYFVAILWADDDAVMRACGQLAERFGELDFTGPDRPFDRTNYYEEETGTDLRRRLVAFETLRGPDELAADKLACNAIEEALQGPRGRRVNLDVGYLDHNKLVLASAKGAGQKIYLRDGIYADLVARYAQGCYEPFPWTFPDFKDGRYDAELAELRSRYLRQLKDWRSQNSLP